MRRIETKMIEFFDNKLKEFGAAQDAIESKDPRSLFIYAMLSCVGIKEKGGNNRGPMIQLIQETVGRAQGEAWCMSLVQTCLAYAELRCGIQSSLKATEGCMDLWSSTFKDQKVRYSPLPGAIVIWQHGDSWRGHTGVVKEYLGDDMIVIEGNTSGGILNRDGDGVFINTRDTRGTGSMKVVGFIKPF